MDFIKTQLNNILLKKKNQTSSSCSERKICLDKLQMQEADETEIKPSVLKTFYNKRVPVQIGYLEKNSPATHTVITNRYLCPCVS